ncbi:MAG: hypothetical protein KF744_10640 [Taibaiella sp.]|nr:hypothetical protein [Taibaiella sp.]
MAEVETAESAMAFLDSAVKGMEFSVPDRLFYYFEKYDLYHGGLQNDTRALAYADSALGLFVSGEMPAKKEFLFRAYMHRANANYVLEYYDRAFEDYAIAKEIALDGGSPCNEFMYVYRIAMVYFREENYLASARLFLEAFNISEKCDDGNDEVTFRKQEILSNIGLAYCHAHVGDSSRYYFYAALKFIDKVAKPDETKWDEARAVIYGNLGTEYASANQFDSARHYYEAGISLGESIDRNIRDRQFTTLKLADLLIKQGDAAGGRRMLMRYDSIDNVLRSRWPKEDNNEFDLRRAAVYTAYYEATSNLPAAMQMMRTYDTLKQRKYISTNRLIKNDLKSGVDRKGHEKQIISLEKDVKIKRLENVILVLSLVIAACIAAITYDFLKKHRRKYRSLERKSRKDELNFIALIENTDDFLWSVDAQYNLLAFNKAYADHILRLTGTRPVVGAPEPLAAFAPNYYALLKDGYDTAFSGQHKEYAGKGLAREGEAPDVKVRFRPIRTQEGVIVGVSCFRTDITEYLQMIDTLERNNERLRDIAWVQSHKLRGPLTTIMSIASYLQEDDTDPETRAQVLKSLQEKLKEMDDIIHEIVSLTKA